MGGETKATKHVIRKKQSGTLLDGRYEIKRIVGKGGFSVVYEAENILTKQRVAIKECTLKDSKERFLKEARILHDFSGEKAIVSVIDTFEENDVAYIVMEYVDGVTLRDFIEQKGMRRAEDVVRGFSSVMDLLIRLHKSGIIHRDISPDNLMVLPDQSLKLLDFGAARDFNKPDVSRLVYKSCYSPPEQIDDKGEMGTYTDVYSLCATMYYCLTGVDPDDVMSRLLLDELETPSSLGSDILPAAEKTLIKGMVLDGKKRLQSVDQLKKELESVYPVLTEEERAILEKRKKRKKLIFGVACAIAAIALIIVVNMYKIEILFSLVDTDSIILDGSHMTDEEYKINSQKVKDRVNAFSNGRFLWEDNGKKISFKVPHELNKDMDPVDVTRWVISNPMVAYFGVPKGEIDNSLFEDYYEQYSYIDQLSQAEDIEEVRREKEKTRIVFSDNARKRIGKYLDQEGLDISIGFDIENVNYYSYGAKTVGDGKTVISVDSENDWISENLEKIHLTDGPLSVAFIADTKDIDSSVKWEDPEDSLFPGSMQEKVDEVISYDDTVCLSYARSYDEDDLEKEKIASELFYIALKSRLDTLGISYAVGTDKYDADTVWIKIPYRDAVWEELKLLGKNVETVAIGSRYGALSGKGELSAPTVEYHDDDVSLACQVDANSIESIRSILKTLEEENKIYLYINNIPIAVTDAETAKKTITENGSIHFAQWNDKEKTSIGYGNTSMADFYASLDKIHLEATYNWQDGYHVDAKDSVVDGDPVMPMFDQINWIVIDSWEKEYGDELEFDYRREDRELNVKYSYPKYQKYLSKEPFESLHAFYQDNKELLENGSLQRIHFQISPSKEPVYYNGKEYKLAKLNNKGFALEMVPSAEKYVMDLNSVGTEVYRVHESVDPPSIEVVVEVSGGEEIMEYIRKDSIFNAFVENR